MDRESFLEALRQQYTEEIHEAVVECEHEGGAFDFTKLNQVLLKMMKHAKVDGLPPKDFEDLVKSALPEHWKKVELSGALGGVKKSA